MRTVHAVQVRIDHRNGTVHFGGQQLESDRVRDHISALARRLTKALHMVEPEVPKQTEAKRLKVMCQFFFVRYLYTCRQQGTNWFLSFDSRFIDR